MLASLTEGRGWRVAVLVVAATAVVAFVVLTGARREGSRDIRGVRCRGREVGPADDH